MRGRRAEDFVLRQADSVLFNLMSETRWYHALNGKALGPVPESEMKALVKAGRIVANDLVWKPGMEIWEAVEKVSPDWLKPEPVQVPVAIKLEKKVADAKKGGKAAPTPAVAVVKGGPPQPAGAVGAPKGAAKEGAPAGAKTDRPEEKKGLWGKLFKR
jgi:hypothetical protein